MFHPQPRVVIACPDRGNMPWELFPPFGMAIRKAAETLDRRIAFVASADLGHAHDAQGPYGYDISSQEFNTALVYSSQGQDLGLLPTFHKPSSNRSASVASCPNIILD